MQKRNIFKNFKVIVRDAENRLIGPSTYGNDAQFEEMMATHTQK